MLHSNQLEGFTSAPIKLAAAIINKRQKKEDHINNIISLNKVVQRTRKPEVVRCQTINSTRIIKSHLRLLLMLLVLAIVTRRELANCLDIDDNNNNNLRHQAHYMNIIPSIHFSYKEGRQLHQPAEVSASSGGSSIRADLLNTETSHLLPVSHIYKRSSALLSSSHLYPPLVGPSRLAPSLSASASASAAGPLRRRMMNSDNIQGRWLSSDQASSAPASELDISSGLDPLVMSASEQYDTKVSQQAGQQKAAITQPIKRPAHEEAELLRQKQHIQYHDQWPSMAGKCHKRTLNFCASVLPFNTTTFPNIIGDTNRFEVKRSLPFFGFLAKSSCNKRLDELLCLLLEPPCQADTGIAIPPCKKFCRLALEGCNEYIPATLAMSSVFDCRQYPDSTDPKVCVNLASGEKCAPDEFKCPDKTCISRNWVCDGVRDCLFAADEANCTAPSGVEQQASVCSTEEFKCDGKCVPKAWKCDGERDCLDGTDEESCDQRPRCGQDRFRCADGNGCLPKRWVCDGKAECRDGSDEMNCDQRECSENDFKCDNGICIPKIWRCDRQFDCKDGSDERSCTYLTPTASPSNSTTLSPATTTTTIPQQTLSLNVSSSFYHQVDSPSMNQEELVQVGATMSSPATIKQESADSVAPSASVESYVVQLADPSGALLSQVNKQLGASLNEDISRIIQQESLSSNTAATTSSNEPNNIQENEVNKRQKDLKKFDYDLIPTSHSSGGGSSAQVIDDEQKTRHQQPQPSISQVDFVAQPLRQQQQQQQQQQRSNFRQAGSQQQQQQQAAASVERVPIYRSLFKTFKGDPNRLMNHMSGNSNSNSPHRYAVRRRRDRSQQQQQQVAISHPSQIQRDLNQTTSSLAQRAQLSNNQQAKNSVASYLPNIRYNLRLSRAQTHSGASMGVQ